MQLNLTKPLAFFDLETTGINVGKDRIVEISIVKINIDNSEERLTQRINPEMPIPLESSKIHGIYDKDIKDEPTFAEAANKIALFLKGCDLSGYNLIRFDVPVLVEEFLRVDIDFDIKKRKIVDVQNIFHKMEQRTLVAAYKYYCDKDLTNAHSAEADTVATYEVFKAQLERYKETPFTDKEGNTSIPIQNDVNALHDFTHYNNNADLSGQIIFDNDNEEVFNFGKYKGQKVSEVFKNTPGYYDWMMKTDFPLYTKKLLTEIKLRGFNK
ncbi:MAG: exonuclease domain-containing protein [Bacteroidota bacterium]|nr:exonuclease domain-containing protein [Bacteroidota bacterium]